MIFIVPLPTDDTSAHRSAQTVTGHGGLASGLIYNAQCSIEIDSNHPSYSMRYVNMNVAHWVSLAINYYDIKGLCI